MVAPAPQHCYSDFRIHLFLISVCILVLMMLVVVCRSPQKRLFFKESLDDSPSSRLAEDMMDETGDEDFQVMDLMASARDVDPHWL